MIHPSLPAARDLAAGGSELAPLPIYRVLDELASGQLVEIMAQHTPGFGGSYAVYPNTRYLRTFIGFLVDFFRAARLPG